jgi:hypothetical protein
MESFLGIMFLISVAATFLLIGAAMESGKRNRLLWATSCVAIAVLTGYFAVDSVKKIDAYEKVVSRERVSVKRDSAENVLIYHAFGKGKIVVFSPETDMILKREGFPENHYLKIAKVDDWATPVDSVFLYEYELHENRSLKTKFLLSPIPRKEEEVILYKKTLEQTKTEETNDTNRP